jgi:hypothetical protein
MVLNAGGDLMSDLFLRRYGLWLLVRRSGKKMETTPSRLEGSVER